MPRTDSLEQVLTAAEAVLSAREDQMLTHVEWEALEDAVRAAHGKTVYYVATLACYVLVDAASENEARQLGAISLEQLYAGLEDGRVGDAPLQIATIRPATVEEIELQSFHDAATAREIDKRD
jgi:hypothetical protein